MTKIAFISDTHNRHESLKLPEADVIVHCGDYTNLGRFDEVMDFLYWFNNLQYKHKVFINGNHEVFVEKHEEWITDYLLREGKNTHFLRHEHIELEGLNFFGSPYTPEFFDWAYMYNRKDGANVWKDIPNDTDVLITHGPPFGILDEVSPCPPVYVDTYAGCQDLLKKIKIVKPKIHAFGHIHDWHGVVTRQNTVFVNASNLGKFGIIKPPIVVEV